MWMNVFQAAEYLGCSRSTIYREVYRGALRVDGKVASQWRFSQETLDHYVTSANERAEKAEEAIRAAQNAIVQTHQGARHLAQRGRNLSRSNHMDRPTNRQAKKARKDSQHNGRGVDHSCESARTGRATLKGELAKLRYALGS